jgi:ABC-type nitrate/sulfonate/bicarbonate transport system ATPase subunit
LLDEPFASLDALTRLSMQLWLQDLWATFRSTVLCVTHDIREAILLSDRIYVLSHRPGTIIKEVAVDLPRPRTRDHLKSPRALELQEELEDLLLAQETTL